MSVRPDGYFDNAATTKPFPEVVAAVQEALVETYGNPSSLHGGGVRAERLVRAAREVVARALGVAPEEVVFTSGATEANNAAVWGLAHARRRRGRHVVTTVLEHPSVLAACERLEEEGFEVTRLPVDRRGLVDPRDVAAALRPDTVLVCVMAVNNEVGSVQPLAAIARILDEAVAAGRVPVRPVLFSDGVQAFGRVLFRPRELGLDAAAVSAHKVHGPKGVGALYLRRGTAFAPLLVGGGQEGGRRAGTENVPGIAGFGAAVRRLMQEEDWPQRLARLRRQLIEGIEARVPPVRLNGPRDEGAAPHIVNLRFPGLRGEVLVHALEAKGYLVSTGSACSSRQAKASHVLRALGLGEEEAGASIRVSFGAFSDPAGVEGLVEALAMAWEELRTFVRR